MTRRISGLGEIAAEFDAVLTDQYGVLHDGRKPFLGAIACLEVLAARDIPVVALTNSGKRAAANAERLARLGFAPALFKAVVSSGELGRERVAALLSEGALAPNAAVALIERGGPSDVLAGLPLRVVSPDQTADLLVIAGAEPETTARETYRAQIEGLARRGTPALCLNPDLLMYTAAGPSFGPGAIAEDYQALGGAVTWLGKPGPEIFAAGLAALGGPDPARCLMIGDSPAHDIAGAAQAGCRTLLVTGGVQSGQGSDAADYAIETLRYE